MAATSNFAGFPRECVDFLSDLKKNNTKEWFAANKTRYDNHVMAPARDFVYEMGKRLAKIAPGIVADPRMDRSIFRPFRDTRFSHDKTPYKTHLGIFMWSGNLSRMDCPGFYFHLEPPDLMLGVGNHCFSKPLLTLYRDSVVDPVHGAELAKAVKAVKKKGDYEIGVKHYKQIPRGYDKEHQNGEFLLFSGLTSAVSSAVPPELYTAKILDYAFERFKDMAPIHNWLLDMIGRAGGVTGGKARSSRSSCS